MSTDSQLKGHACAACWELTVLGCYKKWRGVVFLAWFPHLWGLNKVIVWNHKAVQISSLHATGHRGPLALLIFKATSHLGLYFSYRLAVLCPPYTAWESILRLAQDADRSWTPGQRKSKLQSQSPGYLYFWPTQPCPFHSHLVHVHGFHTLDTNNLNFHQWP